MTEILIRHYAGVSGVAVLTYDLMLTGEQEVECIWRSSKWTVKGAYLIARYWGLAFQIFNLIYISRMAQFEHAVDCKAWFRIQGVVASVLICNLEMIVMLRVYALYNRNSVVGTFLAILFFSTATAYAIIGMEAVRTMDLNSECLPTKLPDRYVMMFSVTMMANQIVLLGLTVYGYWASIKPSFSRNQSPILRVVIRDNSSSCLALCVVLISGLQFGIQQLVHIMPCIWCALLSVVSCRLILNMRSLRPSPDRVQQSPDPELNTNIMEWNSDL